MTTIAVYFHCGCKYYDPVLVGQFNTLKAAREHIVFESLASFDAEQFNQYKADVLRLEHHFEKLFRQREKTEDEVDQSYWIAKRQAAMSLKIPEVRVNSFTLVAFPSKRRLLHVNQKYPHFHRLKLSSRITNDDTWQRHFKQYYENSIEIYFANIHACKCFKELESRVDFCCQPTVWLIPILFKRDIAKFPEIIKLS